ncbi:MAG: hypothetical protein NUW23_05545 [Firmicutes bacterium]|jgi:maltose alpha-D-glucosyltransferase/alpha-amylase|nr:hypothetical protein [Bacillota bacterium]
MDPLFDFVIRRVDISVISNQRWFGAKAEVPRGFTVSDYAVFPAARGEGRIVLACLEFEGAGRYFVPIELAEAGTCVHGPIYATARGPWGDVVAADAAGSPGYVEALAQQMESGGNVAAKYGRFEFRGIGSPPRWRIMQVSDTHTNSLVGASRASVFKTFRRMVPGINPDVEIGAALAEHTSFRETSTVEGEASYIDPSGARFSIAVRQAFVDHLGDLWGLLAPELHEVFGKVARGDHGNPLAPGPPWMWGCEERFVQLGQVVARLHAALASVPAKGFGSHPVSVALLRSFLSRMEERLDATVRAIRCAGGGARCELERQCRWVLENEGIIRTVMARITSAQGYLGQVIRCHGDLHLGQVLATASGFAIVDFEGEPLASLEERRMPSSPLRDVAGMLRSLNYAAESAILSLGTDEPRMDAARAAAFGWEASARRAFLTGYFGGLEQTGNARLVPAGAARDLILHLFELEKALYELRYEINNRPDWVMIPLRGVKTSLARVGGGAT